MDRATPIHASVLTEGAISRGQQLRDELLNPAVDLIPDRAYRTDVLACRVFQLPVLVASAREAGTGIAASHGDDDV